MNRRPRALVGTNWPASGLAHFPASTPLAATVQPADDAQQQANSLGFPFRPLTDELAPCRGPAPASRDLTTRPGTLSVGWLSRKLRLPVPCSRQRCPHAHPRGLRIPQLWAILASAYFHCRTGKPVTSRASPSIGSCCHGPKPNLLGDYQGRLRPASPPVETSLRSTRPEIRVGIAPPELFGTPLARFWQTIGGGEDFCIVPGVLRAVKRPLRPITVD